MEKFSPHPRRLTTVTTVTAPRFALHLGLRGRPGDFIGIGLGQDARMNGFIMENPIEIYGEVRKMGKSNGTSLQMGKSNGKSDWNMENFPGEPWGLLAIKQDTGNMEIVLRNHVGFVCVEQDVTRSVLEIKIYRQLGMEI